MFFPDLSPYEHSWPGEYEAAYCGLPVKSIGWLSGDHAFPTGDVPEELPRRLLHLCATQLHRNPSLRMMGSHNCEFCLNSQPGAAVDVPGRGRIHLGSDEIRVGGPDCTYAAPNLIYHYVTAHRYRPPDEFMAAVLVPPARQARAQEMYAYHLWEASLKTLIAGGIPAREPFLRCVPGSLANTMLGRLVNRYRLSQGAVCAGLTLMLLASKPVALFLGVSSSGPLVAGALLSIALVGVGAYWAMHLPCPLCGAALKPAPLPQKSDLQAQMHQRPPQWHDRFKLTEWLFCDSGHFLIQYRLSPFPWSAPPCHVWCL